MANNRIILDRLPQNDDELFWAVKALWGVTIPRTRVCPDHVSPFEVFADAYFGRGGSISLWHGSRGLSGKSFMLSILGITKAFLLGADVNMLGGSLAQSTNIHEHMRMALNNKNAPRYMIETEANTQIKLNNNARIRPLTASQKTVRGPHPPFLILDEIDEMDIDILDAALGQPMPQKNYKGEIISPYTVMCVAGDTQVLTSEGEVAIRDVFPDSMVMTRQGWRRVKNNIFSGKRRVVQVELSNGRTLTCTLDHRIAINGDWLTPLDMFAVIQPSEFRSSIVANLTASTALSSAVYGDERVLSAVGMPSGAVSLLGVDSARSTTALDVDFPWNRLKMGRITAGGFVTDVIEFQTFRNGADEFGVSPTVDDTTVVQTIHVPVPARFRAIPEPTAFRCDGALGDEPVFVVGISSSGDHLVSVYDLEVEDVHEFVAESIVVHNCSTWQNADGTFTEVKRRFEERGLPIKTWCYRESANDVDGWLTQETIDAKKLEIPTEMWRVEYELGEPSIGNRAFDTDAVEKTFNLPLTPIYQEIKDRFEYYILEEPVRDGIYVVSADWAKEQDFTVISVVRIDQHPHKLVEYRRVNRRPYPMMINWFNESIDRYNAEAIHDATGLGNVVNDYIDVRARKFIMTGEKRSNMLTEYVGAVERGYFQLPRIASLYSAHKYCRTGDLYSNTMDYHLPDEVCSMALAWNAGKKFSGYGDPIAVPKTQEELGRYEKHFAIPPEYNDGIIGPSFEVEVKTEGMDSDINLMV